MDSDDDDVLNFDFENDNIVSKVIIKVLGPDAISPVNRGVNFAGGTVERPLPRFRPEQRDARRGNCQGETECQVRMFCRSATRVAQLRGCCRRFTTSGSSGDVHHDFSVGAEIIELFECSQPSQHK